MNKTNQIRDIFRKPKGMVSLVLRDPKTNEIVTDENAIRSVMTGYSGTIVRDEDPVRTAVNNVMSNNIFVDAGGEINLAHNLVVTLARENMSRLIAGDSNASGERYVTKMSWGSAGHNPSLPTQAISPSASDTSLSSEITSVGKKTVTYDFPNSTTVRFISSMSEVEAVGEGLSEVGLWTDDEVLFARKTFGLITKSSSFTFEFRWRILF